VRTREHGPLGRGSKLLKYEIEAELGRGGHAWVYRALDPFLGRRVAIKVLHRAGGVSDELLRRGQLEAQLLVRLRHPNIVEVIDAGVSDQGQLYIVMELLRGRPLRAVLRHHGRLRVDEALPLFRQVAEGVELAHRERAVHRDLKPENIFVGPENRPKVLDFGIAKVAGAVGITTQKDLVHGTMLYMSPEQLQGVGATARSDVYALGTAIYEALLGRHPCILHGPMPSVAELARIQTFVQAPPIDQLDPTIPRHVARLVTRAIAKHPDDRFQSMTELADALAEAERRFFFETGSQSLGPLRDLSAGPASASSGAPASAGPSGAHTFEPLAVSPARAAERDTDASGPPALASDENPLHPVQHTERLSRDALDPAPPDPARVREALGDATPSTEPHVSPLPERTTVPLFGYGRPLKLGALAGIVLGGVVLVFTGGGSVPRTASLPPTPTLAPPAPARPNSLAASTLMQAPIALASTALASTVTDLPPPAPLATTIVSARPKDARPAPAADTRLAGPLAPPLEEARTRANAKPAVATKKETGPVSTAPPPKAKKQGPQPKPNPTTENPLEKPFSFPSNEPLFN
jgi:serine/threonine protein kinase